MGDVSPLHGRRVPITWKTCPHYMGDGDDLLVVENGRLWPFDISLRRSCRLQSKSISSSTNDCTVDRRRVYSLLLKRGPSSDQERRKSGNFGVARRTVCRRRKTQWTGVHLPISTYVAPLVRLLDHYFPFSF